MPTDLRVVLIGSSFAPFSLTPGQSIPLQTIKLSLEQRGFSDIVTFPRERQYDIRLVSINRSEGSAFKAELDSLVEGAKRILFGISTTTPEYVRTIEIAKVLKNLYPRSEIVLGGQHLQPETIIGSDGTRYKGPIEVALESGYFDKVFAGHASHFVSYVCDHNGELSGTIPKGLYYMDPITKRIIGESIGHYPQLDSVPFVLEDASVARIITRAACMNSCDYCSVNRGSLGFSREVIRSSLEKLLRYLSLNAPGFTYFDDSNPFEQSSPLLDILDDIEAVPQYRVKKFGFFDPSLFCDASAEDLLIRLVMHGFIDFFTGREVVCEEISNRIGAKLGKKVKNQTQLDNEKSALLFFVGVLKEIKRNFSALFPIPFCLRIAYIVTPFETEDSAIKLFEEMRFFASMADEGVIIKPFFNFLAPYPGTLLRSKYIDLIDFPERFDLFAPNFCLWNPHANPDLINPRSLNLLHQLILLGTTINKLEKFLGLQQNPFTSYLEFARGVFSGEIPLLSQKEIDILFYNSLMS